MEAQNPQTQGQNPSVDEFDTTAEQGELDALNAEIEQNQALFKANFADYAAQNTTPEMEELFFEDKKAFYEAILDMENAFYAEQIASKQGRAEELSSNIGKKQGMKADKAAVELFKQNHPEIDINELIAFYEQLLPPKIRQELDGANLPPEQFYEALLSLYQQFQGAAAPQGSGNAPLPQEINGAAAPASSVQGGGENFLPTTRM